MAKRVAKEITVDEFNDWCNATKKFEEVAEAADEEGGPRLSLVPAPATNDFRRPPDEIDAVAATGGNVPDKLPEGSVPFAPEPSRKRAGWSAFRQRIFIEALAETGSVRLAAKAAGLSARSAYALRVRSVPFDTAWRAAEQLAAGRLAAIAFDRAIHGRIDQVWHGGELVGERRVPNDKMLMWLLARLDSKRFALARETAQMTETGTVWGTVRCGHGRRPQRGVDRRHEFTS